MTDVAEPELPRGIALAWGVAANPQRGPKREMSVERIVEAAVEIADAEVSRRCRCTATSPPRTTSSC